MADGVVARSGRDPLPDRGEIRTTKRRGRGTPGQRRALGELWQRYGLELPAPAGAGVGVDPALDLPEVFGRTADVVLDVGFGMGEATAALARAEPERDVLAVDLHAPGAGALLAALEQRQLSNVRVLVADARAVLRALVDASLAEVRVFFPDPWPKPRHHKRRLVTAEFVALAADRLAPGGRLHLATDWPAYGEQMLRVVRAEPRLRTEGLAERAPSRPETRFERVALDQGRPSADLLAYRR